MNIQNFLSPCSFLIQIWKVLIQILENEYLPSFNENWKKFVKSCENWHFEIKQVFISNLSHGPENEKKKKAKI